MKKKKGRKKTGWYLGLHHIQPTSRGGDEYDDKNIYPRDRWGEDYDKKHENWHILFVNMTPKEVLATLRAYTDEKGRLSEKFFNLTFSVEETIVDGVIRDTVRVGKNKSKNERKKKAWWMVFGDMRGSEVIDWVEREFLRRDWL